MMSVSLEGTPNDRVSDALRGVTVYLTCLLMPMPYMLIGFSVKVTLVILISWTVTVQLLEYFPLAVVAVMVVVPGLIPLTRPDGDTVAT